MPGAPLPALAVITGQHPLLPMTIQPDTSGNAGSGRIWPKARRRIASSLHHFTLAAPKSAPNQPKITVKPAGAACRWQAGVPQSRGWT